MTLRVMRETESVQLDLFDGKNRRSPSAPLFARPPLILNVTQLLRFGPHVAFIARVGSMPRQGIASAFRYGRAVGSIESVIAASGIPIKLIESSVWKRALHLPGKHKEEARQLALQLFPDKHPLLVDIVAKRFWGSDRARMNQVRARLRNIDSNTLPRRFDCCRFLFHKAFAATFATISAREKNHGRGKAALIGLVGLRRGKSGGRVEPTAGLPGAPSKEIST
jgi:hypothetical protein